MATPFRLMTYNIHRAIGVDRKFRPDRIEAVLRHHDPDIALLQEVDEDAPRSSHMDLGAELARWLRYEHRAQGMNVYLRRGRYGNVTLSRFPIGRQRNIDLTIGRKKRRGAQHTSIEIPTPRGPITVDVFNLHLGLSAMERRSQIAHLLSTHDITRLPPDAPCLVAGDMNDWRGLLKRQWFRSAGFECATNRRPGSRWAIKTFPSYAPTGGLDKIFYRGALRPTHVHQSRLKLARVASDHLPVIAEFEI
jgi:endonuclease/exonuclease/phosphatase family metal-dependent hydrolase